MLHGCRPLCAFFLGLKCAFHSCFLISFSASFLIFEIGVMVIFFVCQLDCTMEHSNETLFLDVSVKAFMNEWINEWINLWAPSSLLKLRTWTKLKGGWRRICLFCLLPTCLSWNIILLPLDCDHHFLWFSGLQPQIGILPIWLFRVSSL